MNRANVPLNGNGVWLELGERNKYWKQYDLYDAPIKLIGPDGERTTSNSYKAVLRGNDLAAIVGSRYQLFPNEEALRLVSEAGWEPASVNYGKNGNTLHASYLSDKFENVGPKDTINIGFMLRNSIDGSVGFGADIFTYRLICSNGAIARGEELFHISRKHTANSIKEIVGDLKKAIDQLLQSAEELISYYRKWNEVETSQKLFDNLSDTIIPRKYAPQYAEVRKADGHLSLKKVGKTPTVWNTFNYYTNKIWHNKSATMHSKTTYLNLLHQAVVKTVV